MEKFVEAQTLHCQILKDPKNVEISITVDLPEISEMCLTSTFQGVFDLKPV